MFKDERRWEALTTCEASKTLQRTCISLGYFAVRNRTNYLMSAKRNALKEHEEDHRLQGKIEEFVHRKDREQECPGGSG